MAKSNKLWTKTAFAKVPALYATDGKTDKVAPVKIFANFTDHRYYIIEYNPETGIAFCLVTNLEVCELEYLDIRELQELNDNFRAHGFVCPPFQRELHGTPRDGYKIAEIQAEHARSFFPAAV